MHTYRTAPRRIKDKQGREQTKAGWQAGFDSAGEGRSFTSIGPVFEHQHEAAGFAAFLNGGQYNPEAVEDILKPSQEEQERQQQREQEEEEANKERDRSERRARGEKVEEDEKGGSDYGRGQRQGQRHDDASTRSQADDSRAKIEADDDLKNEKTRRANRAAQSQQHVKRTKGARKHK